MKQKFTRHLLILMLLSLPLWGWSQYPTAPGTRWDYFQILEDWGGFIGIYDAWSDEIVGDTVVGSNTYQIVRRVGSVYNVYQWPAMSYDTLDGTFYTRVQGDSVWVLDGVVQGNPVESLLYNFGVAIGDTISALRNLINLTPGGQRPYSIPWQYDTYALCDSILFCDTLMVKESFQSTSAYIPASFGWSHNYDHRFLDDIGTIYCMPEILVLDIWGQHYFLKQLTVDGNMVYENPGIAAAVRAGSQLQVRAYPNPVHDRLRLQSAQALRSATLMDALGRPVRTWSWDAGLTDAELEVGDLPRGHYWLVVGDGAGFSTRAISLR